MTACPPGLLPACLRFADVPDVQEIGVGGGGDMAMGFAGGAVEGRADFFLGEGEFGEGNLKGAAVFELLEILEDGGDDLLVLAGAGIGDLGLDDGFEVHEG